jgi:hypothetical protein
MLKIVLALVLVAHGIGHSLGLLGVFNVSYANPEWHGDSWLLTKVAGPTFTDVVGVLLWVTALVGFVVLGGVVMGWLPASWWVPLAAVSSVASLLGVLFFPVAFPTFSTVGAVVVDLVVLYAALVAHWVPADLAA